MSLRTDFFVNIKIERMVSFMFIAYHLLDLHWRKSVDLREYESYILHVASRFPMITILGVRENYFGMRLNVVNDRARRSVIQAYFRQLARTPLGRYGNDTGGSYKVFIAFKEKA